MTTYDEQLDELRAFGKAEASAKQGGGEWLRARAGKVTASRFKDVMSKGVKGGYLKARQDYLWEIVVERITGRASDHFASVAMQWGTDNESAARMAYEARTGAIVDEVGFLLHPTLEGVGGSPDGLVGDDGGWEGKCPFNSAIHLQTVLDGMPDEHKGQVQGLMWITGRKWWDFESHDPRLPAPFDTYIQRIPRDETYIAELEREVVKFLAEVDAMVNALKEHAPK